MNLLTYIKTPIQLMKMTFVFCLLSALLMACSGSPKARIEADNLHGDLVIFHAGSLSVPMHQIADSFKVKHPSVNLLLEAAGSKACARKITDLKKPCDVFASADYKVIENMLIPAAAKWCIRFAGNEMAIVYTEKSKYAASVNEKNWQEILLRKDVTYGRSDPDSDPCGVRAVLTMQLSERYYKTRGVTASLLEKNKEMIRPKETDLIALLETGTVDYIFLYRSVAQQHGLKYVILPDSVNLKQAVLSSFYQTASLEVRGKTPTERVMEVGAAMVYGVTIPSNAANPVVAEEFVKFLLTEGVKVMEKNGQPSLLPSPTATYDQIPGSLKSFARKE